jgi:hypothetical protein
MDSVLQEKLYKNYPKIFAQKDLPMSETCMCWGVACDDGWYDLIDKLCSDIQDYIDVNKLEQVEAVQVKEKFGGLRFYVDHSDEHVEDLITDAEIESLVTCERCGSKENVGKTTGGWIVTICKDCADKDNIKGWRISNEK